MSSRVVMVTTSDNPFNPFEDWDAWQRWDEDHGYHTMSYLARIARIADDLPIDDFNRAVEFAVDEICELNVTGNYKKVYENKKLATHPGDMIAI